MNKKICLNLGCGEDYHESDERTEWINIDVRPEVSPDLVIDLEKELLTRFNSESIDGILCQDFLEHLSWHLIPTFLTDCHRALKKNGKIYIRVPDLEAIAKKVILSPDHQHKWRDISYWVYGSGDYGPPSFHRAGFTIPALKDLLEQIGFKVEVIKNDGGTNIITTATKLSTAPRLKPGACR